MSGYSDRSFSFARKSGTRTNVFLSLLIVSMFLLASVAFVADVSVADDAKGIPKMVGTIHITENGVEAEGWNEGTDYEYIVKGSDRTLTLKGGSYIIDGDAIDYQLSNTLTIALAGNVSIKSAVGITGTTPPLVIKGHGSLTMDCSGPAFRDMIGLIIVPDEGSEVEVNVNSTVVVFTSLTIRPGATLNVNIDENKPAIECLKVMLYGNLFIRSTANVPAINTTEVDVLGGFLRIDSIDVCSNGELVAAEEKGNIPFVYAHSGKSMFPSFSFKTAKIELFGSDDGYDWHMLSDAHSSYIKIGVPVKDGYRLERTEGGKISFLDPRIDDDYIFLVNEPVTLKAVADHGYRFKQWSDGSTDHPNHLVLTSADGNTYSATFEVDPSVPDGRLTLSLIALVIALFCAIGVLAVAWKKD